MSAITPSTDLYLLKAPLGLDNENQFTFASATAQYNYFYGLPKTGAENFTYQRHDGVIRYPAHIDSIIEYNYVMYRNDAYSNKWFYAYIKSMRYINDNMTEVTIEQDYWQTWEFSVTLKPSFVEREHVSDDTIGKHTVPEGLETGEYTQAYTLMQYNYGDEFYLCFQVTEIPASLASAVALAGGRSYNGIYSGLFNIMCPDASTADALVADYGTKQDAIVAIYVAPVSMFGTKTAGVPANTIKADVTLDGKACSVYIPKATNVAYKFYDGTFVVSRQLKFGNYVPKNNKLFCYPYSYIAATNNAGADCIYHWEDFYNQAAFSIYGALEQGCSIKLVPMSYKRPANGTTYTNDAYNYGIMAGKLPLCAWKSDYYTNWQTQQAVNQSVSVIEKTLGGIAAGAVTGGLFGAAVGGAAGLLASAADVMTQHYEASLVPDQAKGSVTSGGINFSVGKGFTLAPMSIKEEYARIIDGYFSEFGYKVNEVKTPNINSRTNWNYVKTIGCNLSANIPQDDAQKIKDMFNSGITFWHNTSTFLDYSQSNAIVTP